MHPSTRFARNLFKQRNHVFSCCFIVVVSLLVINLQWFNSFVAWVIIRVVCPPQIKGVSSNRASRPFSADRDFADTGQGVLNPPSIQWHIYIYIYIYIYILCVCVCVYTQACNYDSFAMVILSLNHREVYIAELISVSIKVIIWVFSC